MLDTNWLLEDQRHLYHRYQSMRQRIEQIEKEWASVPFHWDTNQLAYISSVADQYQALCAHEIDWRMNQYRAFERTAQEADDAEYAQLQRDQMRHYWDALTEWRHEAEQSRTLVQRVERGVTIYQAYHERTIAEHAAYLERVQP